MIRRGKKIHSINYVELVEYDDLFGSAVFRVKDDSYATYYKVHVQKVKDPKEISLRCACPYNLGDICRHEAAALFQLQEMIDKGQLRAESVEYDQRHTVAKMKQIDLKTLRLLSSAETIIEAEKFLLTNKTVVEYAHDETVKAKVELHGKKYTVIMKTKHICFAYPRSLFLCSCLMPMGLIISILSGIGIKKKINCLKRMVIH